MRSNWTSRGSQADVVDLLDRRGGLIARMALMDTRVRVRSMSRLRVRADL